MSTAAEQESPAEEEVLQGVARRIRAARLNADLSQADLAEKTGLKRAYVYELERGTSNPTLKTLTKVAGALGFNPVDLMPQSEQPRLSHRDAVALLAACDEVAAAIRAEHEATIQRSLGALRELRTRLEKMVPLSATGEIEDQKGTESPARKGAPLKARRPGPARPK